MLIYLTRNDLKFAVAERALQGSGIALVQKRMDAPEIQSSQVEEVAAYAGEWASSRLDQPVALTDGGFHIEALGGFPGPFVKFVNQWLTVEDLLSLMRGKENRGWSRETVWRTASLARSRLPLVDCTRGGWPPSRARMRACQWIGCLFLRDTHSRHLISLPTRGLPIGAGQTSGGSYWTF
jgi:hypothetical protein